ncbi:uncharacterized protein LOC141598921 [Silene latifolia]|uniref:uncharacterized protein LOC141598921 n=1 Tax=Silene latifolia TaxID=37657 RepID=UPI003D771012
MTEFGESFKGKEDVNFVKTETCDDGVSAKRKHFLGVRKKGKKWQARIHHPILKVRVSLGYYSTPEEAALVVIKKKAEFKETLKGEGDLRKKRDGDASFGAYSTSDEAAVVADRKRKRAELRELYGGKPRGSGECEDDDKVLQETESETKEAAVVADRKRPEVYGGKVGGSGECEDDDGVLQEIGSEVDGKFGYANEQTSDVKVLAGVRRVRSGKQVARIKDSVSNDVNIVQSEACDGVLAKRKHFLGVRKKGNKWQARIHHPKLKVRVSLGYYSTPEEAALVVQNKKAEFKETLKGEGGLKKKRDGDASFGAYSTCDEAIVVADRKRAEFRELYGGKPRGSSVCEDDDKVLQETTEGEEAAVIADRKRREVYGGKVGGSGEYEDDDGVLQEIESEVVGKFGYTNDQTSDVKVLAGVRRVRSDIQVARIKDPVSNDVNIVQSEACDGVLAKMKHLLGVRKRGNKWQAIIQHPKLKVRVSLGYYSTPEEAALVVKMKKAEFKESLKGEGGLREKRPWHEFAGRKLPSGVTWQRGKFCVRIWHPELKKYVSFGQYSTCDEAVVVADRKRAELGEVHGGEEVAGKLEFSDEQTSDDVKVPASVRGVRSGKSVARDKHLGSRARIWLGTYDTAEEAIRSYDKNVAVQMGYDGLNNFEIGDKLNCGVVDVPDKLDCEFVQGSPTSNIEPGMSGDKRVIDKESQRKTSCGLDFDEAVSAGFINEYGQLLGKYHVLDEQLDFGLPDEIVAGSG